MLGIAAMVLAVMCFAGIDAQSKLMGEMGYNAIQITWGRLLNQLGLLAPFGWAGWRSSARKRPSCRSFAAP